LHAGRLRVRHYSVCDGCSLIGPDIRRHFARLLLPPRRRCTTTPYLPLPTTCCPTYTLPAVCLPPPIPAPTPHAPRDGFAVNTALPALPRPPTYPPTARAAATYPRTHLPGIYPHIPSPTYLPACFCLTPAGPRCIPCAAAFTMTTPTERVHYHNADGCIVCFLTRPYPAPRSPTLTTFPFRFEHSTLFWFSCWFSCYPTLPTAPSRLALRLCGAGVRIPRPASHAAILWTFRAGGCYLRTTFAPLPATR